ncbi:MAG: DUF1887 family CARF protein [Pseudomonadota bacterium]|nr:DUF1887 family CARF protein [Pseudomonadota bacterium]
MLIHIVIVSGQTLPNLIPILMERPGEVWLVTSAVMSGKRHDKRLRRILEKEGITVRPFPDAPESGFRAIQDYACDIADQAIAIRESPSLVLNITGGTKLMTLAFFDVFRGIAHRIIYTDTSNGRIETLPEEKGGDTEFMPLRDVLDVPLYLTAQGFRYRTSRSDDPSDVDRIQARKPVCKYLGKYAADIPDFLGAINGLSSGALNDDGQLVKRTQKFSREPSGRWKQAMNELTESGLIRWEKGEWFEFTNAEAVKFLNGGWLEEYAWHILKDESPCDVRLGVEGIWDDTRRSTNELDVVAVHGNRMLLIECKTLKHGRDTGKDSDILYKIDSLSEDTRGLFGETWLLSAREPTEFMRDRARHQNIRIIGPDQIPRLKSLFLDWKSGRRITS